MNSTALLEQHQLAGARLVEFAGYEMPLEYTGVVDEHLTVRQTAGMFDASHMGEFWVKGPNALPLLEYVTTNYVGGLVPGKAQYSCLPNGRGGIVDDLIVYCVAPEKYMLVVNASNTRKDWEWLNHHNERFGAVLEDASDRMALIALQGPKALQILQKLVHFPLDQMKSFTCISEMIEGVGEVLISATGYTGAGGFELYAYNEGAPELWKQLLEKGSPLGLKPAGLAARDTLRLEMGYALYGNDIDDTTSPVEAGLGWIIKAEKKGDYIDREIHVQQLKSGVKQRLVGVELIERGIPRKEYPILNASGEVIGRITSGTMSPSLKKGIGMGYVVSSCAKSGTEVYIGIRNKQIKAVVVPLPFK